MTCRNGENPSCAENAKRQQNRPIRQAERKTRQAETAEESGTNGSKAGGIQKPGRQKRIQNAGIICRTQDDPETQKRKRRQAGNGRQAERRYRTNPGAIHGRQAENAGRQAADPGAVKPRQEIITAGRQQVTQNGITHSAAGGKPNGRTQQVSAERQKAGRNGRNAETVYTQNAGSNHLVTQQVRTQAETQ